MPTFGCHKHETPLASKATPNRTPTQDTIVSAFRSPYLWGMAGQQPKRSCGEGSPACFQRARGGHRRGARPTRLRQPSRLSIPHRYPWPTIASARVSAPRARQRSKRRRPERSGLSNQNPFGQDRAARDLVPEEPKQTVDLDLTPPDKEPSVTTPALTFDKAFHANNSASGGQPGGARPPVTRLECRLTGGNHA